MGFVDPKSLQGYLVQVGTNSKTIQLHYVLHCVQSENWSASFFSFQLELIFGALIFTMYLFVWILVKRGLLHKRGSSCFVMSTNVHRARSCGDGHRCHKYGSDVGQSHLLGTDKGDKGGRWPFSAPDTACAGGAVFEEKGKSRLPLLASCLLFMVVAKMRRSRLTVPGSEYLLPPSTYKPCAMGPPSLLQALRALFTRVDCTWGEEGGDYAAATAACGQEKI